MGEHGDPRLGLLESKLKIRYQGFASGLAFHGWHHVEFVHDHAVQLAARNGSSVPIVAAAALVHDLNYMVRRNSDVEQGEALRHQVLSECSYTPDEIDLLEQIVTEASTKRRDAGISKAAQALSDADTLYKALPITPVLLAPRYLRETGIELKDLAQKIVAEQAPLIDQGIYFYDEEYRGRYTDWARANLNLWLCIDKSVEDPTVRKMIYTLESDADQD